MSVQSHSSPKSILGPAFCVFLGSVGANMSVPWVMRELGSDSPSLWVLALLLQLAALSAALGMWRRLIRQAGLGCEPVSCLCATLFLTVATLISCLTALSVLSTLCA